MVAMWIPDSSGAKHREGGWGVRRTFMALGQRHSKRLLPYSTIAHRSVSHRPGVPDRERDPGAILYVAGHPGLKSAVFLLGGITVNRYGISDEIELFGTGRGEPPLGV